MKKIIAIVSALMITACSTMPIHLKHVETGEKVQCGPYTVVDSLDDAVAARRESQCISDFQRQGYERISNSE